MKYIYSIHIIQRMSERFINKEEIETILLDEVPSLRVPSKKDPEVDLILGCVGEKYLVIALNRNSNKLITVRPMRDIEKRLFMEVLL